MKILVTGATGLLGFDIIRELENIGYNNLIKPSRTQMDITNSFEVEKVFDEEVPDIVFHTAAYTNSEQAELEFEKCYSVNVTGTLNIVKMCQKYNCKLIYISSDYVFDGKKDGIYEVDDIPQPLNIYGKTKYKGELLASEVKKHFIVRVSWLFGINSKNFVKKIIDLAKNNNAINVVCDQIGSPTYTVDLAKSLIKLSLSDKYGIYHITNEDYCSWYEFSKYIVNKCNLNVTINPVYSINYKSNIKRPCNSKLSKKSLIDNGFDLLPDYKDALNRYLKEGELNEIFNNRSSRIHRK